MKADARAREATNDAYAGRLHRKWVTVVWIRRRGDAVGPFPDIVKQVVFKIEKLTKRVHRPKAPAALPQPKIVSLVGAAAAQRAAWWTNVPCRYQQTRTHCRVNGTKYLPYIAYKYPTTSSNLTKNILNRSRVQPTAKGSIGDVQLSTSFCFYILQR